MRAGRIASLSLVLLVSRPVSAFVQDSPDGAAQDRASNPAPRDLCSELGGLNTPACIVDPGGLQVEAGLGDWTLDTQQTRRTDTFETGELLFRYGVGGTTEARLGWIAFGYTRTRDLATGAIRTDSGVGDLAVGLKQSLAHPAEGKSGLALAFLPEATLPVSATNVGEGDWSARLLMPTSYKFSDAVSLEMTPEVDTATNAGGSGRHLAYGSALGVAVHLNRMVIVTPEVEMLRDRDPAGHTTMSRASLSLDVEPDKKTIIDVNAVAGFNGHTPDVELAWGIAHKF